MNEKMFKTTLNFLKAHKDEVKESYGSLIIRKIKGGITYKIYFKLVDYEKWDNKPAYMKLESPRKPLRSRYPHLRHSSEEGH